MKELDDEKLQRLLEEQLKADNSILNYDQDMDAMLYSTLFNALADEPALPFTRNIADAVVKQITIENERADWRSVKLTLATITSAGILFTVIALQLMAPGVLIKIADLIVTYKWIALFTILAITIIQVIDKRIFSNKAV